MSKLSVTSPEEILNNPLNTSVSKQHYSFSKSPRFSKNQSYCQNAFYDVPQVKMKRSAAFGYGTKSDFTKNSIISPAPTCYNQMSQFEKKISSQKGRSFGQSRDKMKEFGYICQNRLKNPGPGQYIKKKTEMTNISFTMRPKTTSLYNPVFLDGKTTQLVIPGPGKYEPPAAITKDGKFQISKFGGSGAPIFNPPTSKRFPQQQTTSPGPAHYQPKNYMDKSGFYVLSQNKSDGTRSFTQEQRMSFTDKVAVNSITPGPGNYRNPSDFGHYDHLNLFRTQENFRTTANNNFNRTKTSQNINF